MPPMSTIVSVRTAFAIPGSTALTLTPVCPPPGVILRIVPVKEEWLKAKHPTERERVHYMTKHYIPNIPLSIQNFGEFVAERSKLMKGQFAALLDVKSFSRSAEIF